MENRDIKDQQSEMLLQDIPMGKIDIPSSQRDLGNLTGLVASIQRLGLRQPIVVTPRGSCYRLIKGRRRYHACARLGWAAIPAIILSVDDQLAELIAIDLNLMREGLTPSERDEYRRRRKEICGTLPLITTLGNGGGRSHGAENRTEASAHAANTPLKTERPRRTVRHPVAIGEKNHTREGNGRGGSTTLALLDSKPPRALIPRLITRLFGR